MSIDRGKLNNIRQRLSLSEQNLKDILFEHSDSGRPFLENPMSIEGHLVAALRGVQEAITKLLLIG